MSNNLHSHVSAPSLCSILLDWKYQPRNAKLNLYEAGDSISADSENEMTVTPRSSWAYDKMQNDPATKLQHESPEL
jgi:hypothetical protein